MSIAAVSGQAAQSSQSDTTSLEASKQKILAQIKTLQKEDATKNAKEIQSLQQQAQQIEMQIAEQQAKSQTVATSATAGTAQKVGPAYSVELTSQNIESSTKNISESSSSSKEAATSDETAQTIDLSI